MMRTRRSVPWILAGAVGLGFGVATPRSALADGFGFSFGYVDSPDVYYVPSVVGVRTGCASSYIGAGTVGYGGYYGYPTAGSYCVSTPVFVEPAYPVRYPRSVRVGAYYYDRDPFPVVHRSVIRHREAGRRVYYRGPSAHRSVSRSWGWSSYHEPRTYYRNRSHHYGRGPSIRSHGRSHYRGPVIHRGDHSRPSGHHGGRIGRHR
jgi:hypothetical protein